jgi:hypothetical protein
MNIPLDKYEEFYVCDGHVYLHGEGVESMLIDGNQKVEQEAARKPYANARSKTEDVDFGNTTNLARVAAEIRPT